MLLGGAFAAIGMFMAVTGEPQRILGVANIVFGLATFGWGVRVQLKARKGDGPKPEL